MTRRSRSEAEVYLSKWPEGSDTRRTMRQALCRVASALCDREVEAEDFDWAALRYEDARAIAAELANAELAPRTINKCLSAVRGVLEVAWRMGTMPGEVYQQVKIDNVPVGGEPAGRALKNEEMDSLTEAVRSWDDRQAAAAVAALAGAGARRVELARLLMGHYDPEFRRLTLTGKKNKTRSVPLGERWVEPFERWWREADEYGHMFPVNDARRWLSYAIERVCTLYKLPAFTPHDLRRTFGTHVYKTAGIAMAQKLLGHSSIATTALYVRVDAEGESEAVRKL